MSSTTQLILQELRVLRKAVTQLAGTADLPEDKQLSPTALDKAAKQFQQLQMKRAQWVSHHDIGKHLKGGGWWNHQLIREEFAFTAFIKIGRDYYYDRDQLKALNEELKKRNVSLEQLHKLRRSEKDFEKAYEKLKEQVRTRKTKKSFVVPQWLRDISSTPVQLPERAVVQVDLDQLQQEFLAGKYAQYVDVHKGTHAMLKFIYPYEKYLEAGLRRRLSHWCDQFNTANGVLKEITGKKQVFIPVAPEEQIEL
jgi:hypothetical protein